MGGRVLIPVTGPANQTLGSFGSNFQIQGPAGLPYLNVAAGFQTGNPNAGPVTGSDNYELRDVVTVTKGKHNLSLGGEFALDKTMFLANLNNYGDVRLLDLRAHQPRVAIADFITGQISSFEQDSTYTTHLSTWHIAAFAQDNYRITPRLTANIGLRWDIDTPPVDAHDRTASFVPGQQSTVTPSPRRWARFSRWGQGRRSRHHLHAVQPHFASSRSSHGIRLATARPQSAPQRASSGALPAAMSGTSPATPCRSPFATTLAPKPSLTNIYNVTISPARLPVAASSRTPIRRRLQNSTRAKALKPSPGRLKIRRSTSSTSACSGNCLTRSARRQLM
jgi:hypothetical protein